ncbi:MAG: glycosyl hydrolase family 28-related protein, partial [Limisphaerales bacterium]
MMNDSAVSRRNALSRLGLAAAAALTPAGASADIAPNSTAGPLWNVRDFKAASDGTTNDTAAIQEAIERAHAAGGGTVLLPNGTYLSGTIQ